MAFHTAWVGMRKGFIQIFMRDWHPELLRGGRVTGNLTQVLAYGGGSSRPFFYALGINGINKKCIDANTAQRMLQKFGIVGGTTRLIQNDIAVDSLSVGEPIDVLVYNRNGSHWLAKKNECKECEICPEK